MNVEDTIVLLGGLSILLTFLAIGAGIGDLIIKRRDRRAQRRRDSIHYIRRMK